MKQTYDEASWERAARVVREGAGEIPALTSEEREAVWRRVVATPSAGRRSRHSWRTAIAAMAAATTLGVAGVATAAVLSAHTGKGPVDAEDVELGGPGERLDPSAPDFPQVLDEISRDIRFPSAAERRKALDWEAGNFPGEAGPVVSTGALRLWIAGHAVCAWSNSWAASLRSGDVARQAEAAAVLRSAPTWPSITATDPEQANESEFAWLPALERAITDDNPRAARAALFGNQSCLPGLAPELGMGRSW